MCLAYPMKVIEVKKQTAIVDADGIRKEINIGFLKDVKPGDYVMVHAGFAIEKFNPDKAKDIIETFKEYKDVLRKIPKR
jgi:hydrogenase expression/formation protein HypC